MSNIAFVSEVSGGHKEIFVADVLGRNIKQLTNHKDLAVSPKFSPDGKMLAYTSYHPGNPNLYITDWHNTLIGHMQHNMRDPNRDHEHGRIYRVTYEGSDLLKPAKMKGKPIEEVLL